ncbi:hypothetical protein SAMN04488028_101409 [Reichenbachiella agariperforans]|uniref:Uncharacterized protein n=1 Tax=Reichenbachiella agariperforans TaxID=156994 RepID=A0A1M6K1P8_REIAG|nr:hypothetical protein [Reichenbachiella agariperforans]SHJ52792.1 hypothetical protein SAMN04488028_101409 [Reichenbachiella agariperforans]
MKNHIYLWVCLITVTFSHFSAVGQSARKIANKARPSYLEIGLGLDYSTYRDFATSPLVYRGLAQNISLHYQRMDKVRETRFGGDYYHSNTYASLVKNEVAVAAVTTLTFNFSKLYQIKSISSDKWSYKAGGMALFTGNLRANPTLQNATYGYEIFFNLLGSAKITRDLSRQTEKSRKFLFIKYKLKPRDKNLSFQLNVGLLNHNIRNGYTYINQESLLNSGNFLFADYEINSFSGFRMSSALEYTHFLANKNALKFSYVWDAYTTGGEENQFEASHHNLKIALLFGLKK